MAPATSKGWRELQRVSQADCPKIFCNFSIGQNDFTLLFTDLVGIWQCELDKSAILAAAKSQHTSIDPSESNSQLQVLLQKLEQGLGSNGNFIFRNAADANISLRTYVRLPKPLSPLLWTFELVPQDAAEMGEELLRPCLFEASLSKQKLKSLHQVIKDKDHVISRLLEKLEGSHTDLGLIFPGVKSRKGRVTANEAEKHIPGMATFDMKAWSAHFDNDSPYASYEVKGFDQLITGCQKCPKHTARQHSDWLKDLPIGNQEGFQSISPEPEVEAKSQILDTTRGDESTASEDEFERQATPPHLRTKDDIQHKNWANKTAAEGSRRVDRESDTDDQKHKQIARMDASQNYTTQQSNAQDRDAFKMNNVSTKDGSGGAERLDSSDSETASEDDDLGPVTYNSNTQARSDSAGRQRTNSKSRHLSATSSTDEEQTHTKKQVKKLGTIKRSLQRRKSESGSESSSSTRSKDKKASSAKFHNDSRRGRAEGGRSPSSSSSPTAPADSRERNQRLNQTENRNPPDTKISSHNHPATSSRKLGRIGKPKEEAPVAENRSRKARAHDTDGKKTMMTTDVTESDGSLEGDSTNIETSDGSRRRRRRGGRENDVDDDMEAAAAAARGSPTKRKPSSPSPDATDIKREADNEEDKDSGNDTMMVTKVAKARPTSPDVPLTAEDRANQRREDLKRAFESTTTSNTTRTTTTTAALGMRKKRKF